MDCQAIYYTNQLEAIEDPLHFGKTLTMGFAIFAEVVCPLLMISGIATRQRCRSCWSA